MKICAEWKTILTPYLIDPKVKSLEKFVKQEYLTKTIYPSEENVFNSINHLNYNNIKVVIVGQDPYHEPGQAHGLAFSVENGKLPPSLVNIFKEIKSDIGEVSDKSGNLSCWAKQGVLLLNTVLTVEKGNANSHKNKGWEIITTGIIKELTKRKDPIVFILWGSNARAFAPLIDKSKHLVLECAHPSPLSAYNGFFGCKHFSKTNSFLIKNNKTPIVW